MAACGDGFGALCFGLTRRPPMPEKRTAQAVIIGTTPEREPRAKASIIA